MPNFRSTPNRIRDNINTVLEQADVMYYNRIMYDNIVCTEINLTDREDIYTVTVMAGDEILFTKYYNTSTRGITLADAADWLKDRLVILK